MIMFPLFETATNIHGALRKALNLASRRSNITDARDIPDAMMIFLTDGLPTVGEVKPNKIHSSIRSYNTETKASNINIFRKMEIIFTSTLKYKTKY